MNETKYFDGVNAIKLAEEFLQNKEIETNERFVKVKSNNFKIVGQQVKLNKVFWEEHSSPALPIAFDGVPFAIIGRQVLECCHGPDRHRSQKKKKAKLKECDHLYTDVQRRRNLQTTHKLECPASVIQRYVVRFPEYMIQSNSDYQRKKMGAQLKADLQKGLFITQVHRVYLSYPPQDSHRFHLQDELGTLSHRVDKRIITKIRSLVHEGIRSVSEMRRHIEIFSKENFPTASRLSNQFYPTNKDIRNHMYSALCLERCAQQLWQLQQDYDIPVAKLCGITVTDTDVRSLRDSEWLTDNVLDCYLKMLVTWECDQGRKVLHLLSSQVKLIVNGTFQPHNYTFQFAEKHLQMASMVTVSQFELKEKRRRIATEIMLFEEFLTDCCPKCGFDLKPDDEKICCGKCSRYFHFKEYCIGEDLREMGDNNHFSCRLCRIHFWPAQRILKHPEVMKNSVQFTQKEEILEKLKGQFDDDVVLVDGQGKSEERNCKSKRAREPKETEHYKEQCRKRKRKDQRKFMYTFPKKTLRKNKYCVCQQENDGRLYWSCEGCTHWYHPECMGLEEKDEPDLYICPDCQLKRREKRQNSCPTLSEVCEEVRIQMKEESADPMDADNCGDLEEVSNMTPVHFNNPVVQLFYDVQKQKKIIYTIKDSGWGKFVLLAENDMSLFETFKEQVNIDYLLTDNAALRYFLNNLSQNTELMHVSKNVVCLHPAAAVEEFKEWLDNFKVNISSDL